MLRKFIAGLIIFLNLNSVCYASWWNFWENNNNNKNVKAESGEILPDYLSSSWEKLSSSLTGALERRDSNENLPDKSWFGDDKISNAQKINNLLDQAVSILIQGEAGNLRRDASRLREKISKLGTELDGLRNKKITAPDSSMIPFTLTREKINNRITELENEIKNYESEIESINLKIAVELRNLGLELDNNQIDILLNSVTGDDLLNNAVIFSNVKLVVAKLEELAKNETNNLEINRRYTGMYLILNDLLIYTQAELIKKIDADYKPKLNAVIKEAENLQREALTKSRNKNYSEFQRRSFLSNSDANGLTIKVGKLYLDLLNSQRSVLNASLKNLKLNRDLAENTYRTVRSSGELRNLIHSGLSLFDNIGALSMPELMPFENAAMREEFEEINRRLKN